MPISKPWQGHVHPGHYVSFFSFVFSFSSFLLFIFFLVLLFLANLFRQLLGFLSACGSESVWSDVAVEARVAIKADQVMTLRIGPDMEFEAQIEPERLGGVGETRGNRPW